MFAMWLEQAPPSPLVKQAAQCILVCSGCERPGLRAEIVTRSSITWRCAINRAGGFTRGKLYEPPRPGSRDDRDEFMFRPWKDGVEDAEAQRYWNLYRGELLEQRDDRPCAEIIALHDRAVAS